MLKENFRKSIRVFFFNDNWHNNLTFDYLIPSSFSTPRGITYIRFKYKLKVVDVKLKLR